jgi:hypothetical protein
MSLYDEEDAKASSYADEKGDRSSTPIRHRIAPVRNQFYGLQDQPSPSGKLEDRVQRLRNL